MSGAEGRVEWCGETPAARIHRYTLNRLRAEIAPVSPAEFMRFLFAWQHVEPGSQLIGGRLRAVVAQLDGVELLARAWERDALPARVDRYEPAMLDMLCLTGDVAGARRVDLTQVVGATPIARYMRAARPQGCRTEDPPHRSPHPSCSSIASARASFATEIATGCGLDEEAVRAALTELVAAGP